MSAPAGQRHSRLLWRVALWLFGGELLTSVRQTAAQEVPKTLKVEQDVVVSPGKGHYVFLGIGEAKFMRFSCLGGPADVGISLSTYAEHADPLLFVSLSPDERPTFGQHDASSFAQWREDSSGDHFVIARAVSPRGGWLGLHNTRHFAAQALEGVVSVHCSFIVAFDTFFWDHLRSSSICPTGGREDEQGDRTAPVRGFCSGHGTCGRRGVCECDEGHTGPACSHSILGDGVSAEGKYNFQVATNRYQYFRVRVPPTFRGGYLEVTVRSDEPLVVLLRSDGLPTKRNFKLSNFDDWMAEREESVLKFPVSAPMKQPVAEGYPDGRRLQVDGKLGSRPARAWMRDGDVSSWGQLFRRAQGLESVSSLNDLAAERTLADVQGCPDTPTPVLEDPACKTEEFSRCESSCQKCVGCIQGNGDGGVGAGDEGEDGLEDNQCTAACSECVYSTCVSALAKCAANTSCRGSKADLCWKSCGSCMTCFGDRDCGRCGCCVGCLPLAAKCSAASKKDSEQNQFAFVGVFNHQRPGERDQRVKGFADIKLVEDPYFEAQDVPSSWMAALYNPFHDIRSLEFTQNEEYPEGDQYIYSLTLAGQDPQIKQVQLYRDRVTLLHVNMSSSDAADMQLQFKGNQMIQHVLSTRQRAPRSFFDFDQVHALDQQQVQISAEGRPAIWCAIFGAENGFVEVEAQALNGGSSSWGWFMMLIIVLSAGTVMATGATCSNRRLFGEHCAVAADPAACADAVSSLVVEHNPEDEFLHRGGTIGDDGI